MVNLKKKIKNALKEVIPDSWINVIRGSLYRKNSINFLKDILMTLSAPLRFKMYTRELTRMKVVDPKEYALYHELRGRSDNFWFWLLSRGYSLRPELQSVVPIMPEENIQLQFTGLSGERTMSEAFSFYRLIKLSIKRLGLTLDSNSKILDFGCGWGRNLRFFLKDIPSSNIYGIDCDEEIIENCRNSILNCNFYANDIYPPTKFDDNSFDIIYSYSVFSHLSENAHKQWLNEFKRILKPGGVLIATTRDRDFIISCAGYRAMNEADVPFFAKGLAQTFQDTSKCLMDYDSGNYVYEPVGGGGIRDGSFYGETCIPPNYVKAEWVRYFRQLEFINYHKHKRFNQNVIIALK